MAGVADGESSEGASGRPIKVLTPRVEKKSPETYRPRTMLAAPLPLRSTSSGPAKAAMPEKRPGLRANGFVKRYGEGAIAAASLIRAVAIGVMALEFRVCTGAPVEDNQLLRISHWYGAQEHGVDEAEDGRVGADAEGDGEDGDCSEARRFAQRAEGEANVLQQVCKPAPTPHVSRHLLGKRDTSEFVTRCSLRILGRQARFHVLARGEFQVTLNFFVKFFIAPLTPPENKSHDSLSCFAGFKIPAMAPVSWAQRERSTTNCLRPDFVRR